MNEVVLHRRMRENVSRAMAILSAAALIAASTAPSVLAFPPAQQRGQAARASKPVQVSVLRGKYCVAHATENWMVYAENAQRVTFGADFSRRDGRAGASYAISGGGAASHLPGHETPDRSVATAITSGGRVPTTFLRHGQVGPNTFLVEYTNARGHAVTW
jgi:hypothetical protein